MNNHPFRDALLYFFSICFTAAVGWIIWGHQISDHFRYESMKRHAILSDISYNVEIMTSGDNSVDLMVNDIGDIRAKYCTVIVENDDKLLYCGNIDSKAATSSDFAIKLHIRPPKPKSIFSVMVLQHDDVISNYPSKVNKSN
jgi:hypothetical protein